MKNEKMVAAGKQGSDKKGKVAEIEAGHKANKRHKFFTEFKIFSFVLSRYISEKSGKRKCFSTLYVWGS